LLDLLETAKALQQRRIELVSLRESIDTTTATGRCFLSMMGAIHQMERELRAERTAANRYGKIGERQNLVRKLGENRGRGLRRHRRWTQDLIFLSGGIQEGPCLWERRRPVNYSQILEALNNASLFELYRLEQAIRRNLEDPVRIRKIKDSLKVGQAIEYFETDENRLIEARIVELKRTRVLVKNQHDGKLWNIPFYFINLDHADVAISSPTDQLDRNRLKRGDKVAFKDRKGHDLFGEVIQLNPKTAEVLVGTTRWKVSYRLLSSIIEGELGSDTHMIEGQLLGRE
jgi:hypothetical protein